MSNNKNIENFDSFFKDAFNSFEPTPPKGVFEAIQSQVGAAGGSGAATGAGTVAKAGAWGVGKIIIGAVAAVAVATTIYIAASDNENTNKNETSNTIVTTQPENKTTQNITDTKPAANTEANTNQTTDGENSSPVNVGAQDNQNDNGNANLSQAGIPSSSGTPNTQPNVAGENVDGNTNPPSPRNDNSGVDVDAPKGNKAIVGIYLSDKQLCVNDRLTVTIADDLSKYQYRVSFGDGTTVITKIGKPTTHIYQNNGRFKVIAKEISGAKETIEQWVDVKKTKAAFEVQNTEKATFRFVNKSENAVYYTWFFGDNSAVTQETSPTHTFKSFSPKSYKVKLIAMDNVGCLDSFSTYVKQSYTYEDMKPKMYNVFSPGVDKRNDYYEIEINNEENYHLIVLDKSGNKVFESKDKNIMWDGRNMYTGEDCPAANYIVVFSYKIKGFEAKQEKKFVALMR